MKIKHENGNINLEIIYVQCNEQMRDQYRKRDQLMVFFGAVMGIIIANIDSISNLKYIQVFYPCFIIVSLLLSYVFINYMKWNYMYKNSAITIQNLMSVDQNKLNQEIINKIYYRVAEDERCDLKSYLHKTETKIFNVYLILSAVNLFIYVYLLTSIYKSTLFSIIIIIGAIMLTLLYIIYFNYISYSISKKITRPDTKYNPNYLPWIINLFKQKEYINNLIDNENLDICSI